MNYGPNAMEHADSVPGVEQPLSMARQQLLDALLNERFAVVVREWKPTTRTAPIAELLDVLADEQAGIEITAVRDAS